MDSRISYSYTKLSDECSTRRYTYEGHGGQNLDKTLILQKSDNCSDDTVLLRICKRTCCRLNWSSCAKGKLVVATLLVVMVLFCYFNLFSSYLPKTCHILAARSHALKSMQTEVVHIRTKNSISEAIYGLDQLLVKKSNLVRDFTKKAAVGLKMDVVSAKASHHTLPRTLKAITQSPFAILPLVRSPGEDRAENGRFGEPAGGIVSESSHDKVPEHGLPQDAETMLISRIIKSGKSANMD